MVLCALKVPVSNVTIDCWLAEERSAVACACPRVASFDCVDKFARISAVVSFGACVF